MATDRELLELAAKGAGLALWPGDAWRNSPSGTGLLLANGRWVWNPLHHDGDALRLAVGLELDIEFINGDTLVLGAGCGGPDKLFNTRRAIVHAAARIGRAATEPKE